MQRRTWCIRHHPALFVPGWRACFSRRLLMGRVILGALLLLGSESCARSATQRLGPAIPSIAATIAPLSTLDGVYLGTTVAQLRAARPDAVFEPYVGFVEEIEGDTLIYHLDRRTTGRSELGSFDATPFDDASTIEAVELLRVLPMSDSAIAAIWSSSRKPIDALALGPPTCHRLVGGLVPVFLAAWRTPAWTIGLLHSPPLTARSNVTGNVIFAPRLRIVIARDLSLSIPALRDAISIPCPSN